MSTMLEHEKILQMNESTVSKSVRSDPKARTLRGCMVSS